MALTKIEVSPRLSEADQGTWKTYDDFAAGIDTYRMPSADLAGTTRSLAFDDGSTLVLEFLDAERVRWTSAALGATEPVEDPYDAVAVREDVTFLNLPLASRDREAITIFWSTTTGRALRIHSAIAAEPIPGEPQVRQSFVAGTVDGIAPSGEAPAPSRDLIGKRNLYRYSPNHLYEHVYLNSERYAWQCVQGEQRGHGDVDMSTVWRFDHGLYLFAFREFIIPVASVWLHDLGYELRTTGVFLGLNAAGIADHRRAGGHIVPLGTDVYPDAQPK